MCPVKCRRKVFTDEVEYSLKKTCEEIGERFEIQFVEIGADEDHVHFLLQTVPTMKVSEMVKKIKSITLEREWKFHKRSGITEVMLC